MVKHKWLKAKMIKQYRGSDGWTSTAYRKGARVYVSDTPYKEKWTIFSGSHHNTCLKLTTAQAQELVKIDRKNGQVVAAENQERVQRELEWMLWS